MRRVGSIVGAAVLAVVATACTGGYFAPVTVRGGPDAPVQRRAATSELSERPQGMELCILNLSGVRDLMVSVNGSRRGPLHRNDRACTDGGEYNDRTYVEVTEQPAYGAPPGYTKIAFSTLLWQRGSEQGTKIGLWYTDRDRQPSEIPPLTSLGSSWSARVWLEGWTLTDLKATWDAMTPDGRPQVTLSMR